MLRLMTLCVLNRLRAWALKLLKTNHSGAFVVVVANCLNKNQHLEKTKGFVFIDVGYVRFLLFGNLVTVKHPSFV